MAEEAMRKYPEHVVVLACYGGGRLKIYPELTEPDDPRFDDVDEHNSTAIANVMRIAREQER